MNRNRRKTIIRILGVIVALMLVTVIVRGIQKLMMNPEEINQGLEVIKEQEASDVKSVEAKIARLEKMSGSDEENDLPLNERFSSSVIMGDYIAGDFDEFEVLDASSVVSNDKAKASEADVLIDQAKREKPKNLFVVFGRNDLAELKGDAKKFKESYKELLTLIHEEFPKTYIYSVGILPVKTNVLEEETDYEKIDEFNKAIKDLCEEYEVTYIDVSDLPTNADYKEDGIHFNLEFYEMLAEYLAEEAAL